MYAQVTANKTTIKANQSYVGETIEEKVNRIVNNKEPIKDGAPLVYTDRKDGVMAATDIRTDRFEVAIDAMDKVHEIKLGQRKKRMEEKEGKGLGEGKDSGKDGDKKSGDSDKGSGGNEGNK